MDATRYVSYLVGAAAGIAALLYIGRCIGKLSVILQLLVRLPGEHQQLVQATERNTQNIAQLTTQVAALTSDVARLVHR